MSAEIPNEPDAPVRFYEPGPLIDGELELILDLTYPGDPVQGYAPGYEFVMRHVRSGARMGRLGLRIGNANHVVMYAGHIGYSVLRPYRGHHYAARSCRLVFPLALKHGINPVWITCNPDNYPSRRTCELVGGRMIEVVPVPRTDEMYRRGDRFKCRYRIDL